MSLVKSDPIGANAASSSKNQVPTDEEKDAFDRLPAALGEDPKDPAALSKGLLRVLAMGKTGFSYRYRFKLASQYIRQLFRAEEVPTLDVYDVWQRDFEYHMVKLYSRLRGEWTAHRLSPDMKASDLKDGPLFNKKTAAHIKTVQVFLVSGPGKLLPEGELYIDEHKILKISTYANSEHEHNFGLRKTFSHWRPVYPPEMPRFQQVLQAHFKGLDLEGAALWLAYCVEGVQRSRQQLPVLGKEVVQLVILKMTDETTNLNETGFVYEPVGPDQLLENASPEASTGQQSLSLCHSSRFLPIGRVGRRPRRVFQS